MRLFWRRKRPSPPPALDLTPFEGNWVATVGGRVVAYADTAHDILDKVQKRGIRSPTMFYVARPEEIQRWAVRAVDGRICGNCLFDTREDAVRGLRWLSRELPGAVVVTRDGQFDPWRSVDIEGSEP